MSYSVQSTDVSMEEISDMDGASRELHMHSAGSCRLKIAISVGVGCLLLCGFALIPRRPVQEAVPKTSIVADMTQAGLTQLFDLGQLAKDRDLARVDPKLTNGLQTISRKLQEMQESPLAMPIATCVVDVAIVASLMGQVGIIVDATVIACKRRDQYEELLRYNANRESEVNETLIDFVFEHMNLTKFTWEDRFEVLRLLKDGCGIGVSASVALFSFIVSFLAGAANTCAMSMKAAPNPGATCASDISMLSAAIAYLAAAAQVMDAKCPPHPLFLQYPELAHMKSLSISSLFSRRLDDQEQNATVRVLPGLPSMGPLGHFLIKHKDELAVKVNKSAAEHTKRQQAKCALDITGTVSFTAALGIFTTAATKECPAAATGQSMQMGCAMDISAVVAALTVIGGYIAIIAIECPAAVGEKEDLIVTADKACAAGILSTVSSCAYMATAMSDVGRSCGAIK